MGNCTALGTTLAGLLFGLLKNAQALMQSKQIPRRSPSSSGPDRHLHRPAIGAELYQEYLDKRQLQKEVGVK